MTLSIHRSRELTSYHQTMREDVLSRRGCAQGVLSGGAGTLGVSTEPEETTGLLALASLHFRRANYIEVVAVYVDCKTIKKIWKKLYIFLHTSLGVPTMVLLQCVQPCHLQSPFATIKKVCRTILKSGRTFWCWLCKTLM